MRIPTSRQALAIFQASSHLFQPTVRDIGLLESALQRGNLTMYGQELYTDPYVKVAVIVDSISRNHPLLDGNKRLSVVVSDAIFFANGYRYTGSQLSRANFFVAIAEHTLSIEQIANHFKSMWI